MPEFTAIYPTDVLGGPPGTFMGRRMGPDHHADLRRPAMDDAPNLHLRARECAEKPGLSRKRSFTGYGDLTPALARLAE